MMLKALSRPRLAPLGSRHFSIVSPSGTMTFIDHPRYGRVYPVVSINPDDYYFRTARASCIVPSILNTTILYSLFVQPIFVPAITAVICNPLFVLPSLFANYALIQRYASFFQTRSFITNMFLKPNGKQVIVETLDGESRVINNKDFFKADQIVSRYQSRTDLYHGANNYLYIRGNSYAYDSHILTAILNNDFIDVKNVAFDYDVTREFTWDFRELVEIKKRKRTVSRFYRPGWKLFERLQSRAAFERNRDVLASNRQVLAPYELYKYHPDQYASPEEQAK